MSQFDLSAGLSAHFANGRREASRTTIGDSMVELAITCLDNHICDFLFCNGSADLYCASGLRIDLAAHLARGKCCAMNTIASCTASQHNDQVTCLYLAWMTSMWQDTQAPTEDKRVIDIPLVIEDSAIDSG